MYQLTEENKKIRDLFTSITSKYDFLNHLLSFNIDKRWRKIAVKMMDLTKDVDVLDLATGTADVAIEIMRQSQKRVNIVGVDLTLDMLKVAVIKTKERKVGNTVNFVNSPGESIPLKDNLFDYCTIAFGIRNIPDRMQALKEMYRLLKPNGSVIILEFTKPKNPLFKAIYEFYFFHILPGIGGIFSKKKNAYEYLPDSVKKFPDDEKFMDMMRDAGFEKVTVKPLTFGIASIYSGVKK